MTLLFWPPLRLSITALSLVVVSSLLPACGGGGDAVGGDRLRVVTTLPLFADFVREIGGERVDVVALLPSGSDPHTWEPAPSDVKAVAEAEIAFANGLALEPAAIRLIEANLPAGALLVKLGEQAKGAGASVIDANPHLWLDIGNAQVYATIVMSQLKSVDPVGGSIYERNLNRFVKEMGRADEYVRDQVATIREQNRKLVTTHDAFPYLARYLGLEIVAFAEEGPGQEASPDDIARLAMALAGQAVPAVFAEPQIEAGNEVLEQAAADAGVPVCTLYSDSLDENVTSYIELMRFNADELARCLGGGDTTGY